MTYRIAASGCYKLHNVFYRLVTYFRGIGDHTEPLPLAKPCLGGFPAHMFLLLAALLCLSVPAGAQYTGDISNATTQVSPGPSRSVVSRNLDTLQATDFCSGAELTGGTQARQCLQNAVDTLCNRSGRPGGTLYIPAGKYLIDTTVNVTCNGITIQGSGFGNQDSSNNQGTMIIAGDKTGSDPVLKVDTGAHAFGFSLRDLQIYNSHVGRSGPFVEINHFEDAFFNDLKLFAPCIGFKVFGGNGVHFQNVRSVSDGSNCDAFVLSGYRSAPFNTLDVVSFKNVQVVAGNGSNCYAITDFVQTVWWNNTVCETNGRAIRSSCPTETDRYGCPGFFTLNDFESEAFGSGYNLIELRDLVDGFKMTDSWLRGRSNTTNVVDNLVYMAPDRFPAGNLNFNITSSWLKFAGRNCIDVNSANTVISGNQVYGCNFNNVGGVGLVVQAPRATITGNLFCGGDWLADIPTQMGGVIIGTGTSYVTMTGNVFSGNTNGQTNGCNQAYANGATSNFAIANNVGP